MKNAEEIEGVVRLLKEAEKALADVDKKTSQGAGFNVFHLCGIDHYEVWHSKILAEFLNPQGSHGQGTLFLKCFQKLLKDHLKFKGEFSDRTSVTTEVSFDDGRLDILIEDESNKSICVIENKIFAGEQQGQLERYAKWLDGERKKQKVATEKSMLLFLTLNGREAWSINEAKEQERYCRMAYVHGDDASVPCLVKWVDSCYGCKELKHKKAIRYTLEQYKNHIINLAKGEQAMKEDLVKRIKEIAKNGNMAMAAAEVIRSKYEEIQWEIISDLMEEIRKRVGDKCKVNVSCEPKYNAREPGYSFNFGKNKKMVRLWCAWQKKDDLRFFVGLGTDCFYTKIENRKFKGWRNKPCNVDMSLWEKDDAGGWTLFKWLADTPTWDGAFLDKLIRSRGFRAEVIDKIALDIVGLYSMVCEFRESTQNNNRCK